MMVTCIRCKEEKSVTDFYVAYKRKQSGPDRYCKHCRNLRLIGSVKKYDQMSGSNYQRFLTE